MLLAHFCLPLLLGKRQLEHEFASFTRAFAGGRYCPVVQFNQFFYNRQPDTEPSARPVVGIIRLAEQVEDFRNKSGRHTDAVVPYTDNRRFVHPLCSQRYLSAVLAVPGGVCQNVVQYLFQPDGIAVNRQRVEHLYGQGVPPLFEVSFGSLHRAFDDGEQFDLLLVQFGLSADQPGYIEHIINQSRELFYSIPQHLFCVVGPFFADIRDSKQACC